MWIPDKAIDAKTTSYELFCGILNVACLLCCVMKRPLLQSLINKIQQTIFVKVFFFKGIITQDFKFFFVFFGWGGGGGKLSNLRIPYLWTTYLQMPFSLHEIAPNTKYQRFLPERLCSKREISPDSSKITCIYVLPKTVPEPYHFREARRKLCTNFLFVLDSVAKPKIIVTKSIRRWQKFLYRSHHSCRTESFEWSRSRNEIKNGTVWCWCETAEKKTLWCCLLERGINGTFLFIKETLVGFPLGKGNPVWLPL
jgi:hypothetical protein